MEKIDSTEQKILAAAQNVFTKKGMAGARMQEIADEAGINKALLHYYFRNKEKLFRRIFEEALQKVIGQVGSVLDSDKKLFDKIRDIIDIYIDKLSVNPSLPVFVISEIHQNPEYIEKKLFKSLPTKLPKLVKQIDDEISKGNIRPIHPVHLLLNVLSMVIFPFASKPLLGRILQNNLKTNFDEIMKDRKNEVYDFVIHSLTKID